MHLGRTTLSKFLVEQLGDTEDHTALAGLLIDVGAAVKAIAAMTAKGALSGILGFLDTKTVQGEAQKKLGVLTNEIVVGHCQWGGLVAGMASKELEEPYAIPQEFERGRYLLVFDPLDGSSNFDVNVSVGTIFSVLRHDREDAPTTVDFLQPGRKQVAAGYALYGPSTMLLLTVGKGTHGFTLDREIGNFILTHPALAIPEETSEFAIDTSNARFWEPPVQRYVRECGAGKTDVRERDFSVRGIASMVAEVHRILIRGGVFLYPHDVKDAPTTSRLRLLSAANPVSMLIEQAGGVASTGRGPLLDVQPDALHQRVPVILGSSREVQRIERYHWEFDNGDDRPYVSPLFNERSLYRPEPQS